MLSESIEIYNSMADFYTALGGSLEQEIDFTIHSLAEIHATVPMKSPLFRTNYYSIVLIRAGAGLYFLDDRTYQTKPQTIYFNNPGHIKGFEVFQLVHGYVITFSEVFLKQYLSKHIFDEFPFLIAEVLPPQYPEHPPNFAIVWDFSSIWEIDRDIYKICMVQIDRFWLNQT